MNKIITLAACLTATALLQSQTPIFVTPDGTSNGTSWENACNLEEAISVIERSRASAPLSDQTPLNVRNEIWVKGGTYRPSKMLVIPDSVKIYGGFSGTETLLSQRLVAANPVIIDGQDKIGSIFRLGSAVELHGLTIQHGNANGNGNQYKSGGGVWADENSIIANCVITNNTAALNGGGIYANGKVEIINSTIKGNTANGSGNDMFGNCLMMGADQSNAAGSGVDIAGCYPHIPYFGEVSFKSDQTVSVSFEGVELVWSDAVVAEGCNKTTYYGGASGSYYSDCRANNTRAAYGDLFSWCAVARFAHVLCSSPWRVPTVEDFFHLDKAMGGNGDGSGPGPVVSDTYGGYYVNATVKNNYLAWNNGSYGGVCDAAGALDSQGTGAVFWSQSRHSPERGLYSDFRSSGIIRPQGYQGKFYGFSLRCVR